MTFSESRAWKPWQAPPMPQQVVLVRHGETEWSRELKHTGRTDVPLTEEGEQQALQVGKALRGREFARVLASPLRRARETARLAGFEPELRDELMEWDYGDYEGRLTTDVREKVPGWTIWTHPIPNGETSEEVGRRVDPVLDEIRSVDGDVLIFAHGHVLRILGARWLDLPAIEGRLFALDPATLSTAGYEREQPVIRTWNLKP
jgi:probable phosphoglycerate mutase